MKLARALLLGLFLVSPALAKKKASKPAEAKPEVSAFSGRFYGTSGSVLHTWEFKTDGSFSHSTIVSKGGESRRKEESGAFEVLGDRLLLRVGKSTRKLSFKNRGKDGVVLDGAKLKIKTW